MAVHQLRFVVAMMVTSFFFGRLNSSQAGDGPNQVSQSDVAVGSFVDSIFEPELRRQTPPKNSRNASRRRVARRRTGLRAKLVNNPNTSDGSPPFALVDRYGGVLRYVEPVKSVDLESHLGKIVTVRSDTGDILLASQLTLSKTPQGGSDLQLVAFAEPTLADESEPIAAGELVDEPMPVFEEEGPIYFDEGYSEGYNEGYDGGYDEGIDFGGCDDCGRGVPCRRGGACGFGARGVVYVHGEYLIGRIEGMNTPPLVVQFNDLTLPNGPAIGPIETIFGGNRVLEDERHGGRITLGVWLDDYGQWGVEGEYLRLGELEERFTAGQKDGLVPAIGSFIGRPFFNTGVIDGDLTTRGPSQEDVDTNRLDGTVRVDIRSEFQSAGIRLRHNLCCREGCNTGCGDAVGCGSDVGCGSRVGGCGSGVGCQNGPLGRLCNLLRKGTRRTDVLYGLRWTSLDESLQVTEDLQEFTGTTPPLGDDIDVVDRFATENNFLGGEIGYETEWQYRRWSLNLLSKVAIGNTRQRVDINGSTVINDGAPLTGGLLTQRYVHPGEDLIAGNEDDFVVGNIGTYERDEFSMIPEIGLTMGYNLTQRLKLTAGYTLIYWSNVVRPGDQIDIDLNANLLPRDSGGAPDPATIVPRDHPRFEFRQTDLWAQFLSLGAEYTW